jgi:hypothetical protein
MSTGAANTMLGDPVYSHEYNLETKTDSKFQQNTPHAGHHQTLRPPSITRLQPFM